MSENKKVIIIGAGHNGLGGNGANIGTNFFGHDSAIFKIDTNNKEIFAISTERLTRIKHDDIDISDDLSGKNFINTIYNFELNQDSVLKNFAIISADVSEPPLPIVEILLSIDIPWKPAITGTPPFEIKFCISLVSILIILEAEWSP